MFLYKSAVIQVLIQGQASKPAGFPAFTIVGFSALGDRNKCIVHGKPAPLEGPKEISMQIMQKTDGWLYNLWFPKAIMGSLKITFPLNKRSVLSLSHEPSRQSRNSLKSHKSPDSKDGREEAR